MNGDDVRESVVETLDILGDTEAVADIRESESLADDQWIPGEEVLAQLRAAGRLHA